MYHSLIFAGDKNTFADWYLIPSSRPVFNSPKRKSKIYDIPGANGHLDLSKSLTGDVVYENREGSIEFIVDNGQLTNYRAELWYEVYSDILDYLHGQMMTAQLEDEPNFYYEGTFEVNEWKSDPHNSKIVIDYSVFPYKLEQFSSLEDWKWDTFNFENGIIREYKDLRVDGELTLMIAGRRMSVTPSFIVKSDDGKGLDVEFAGAKYHLDDGASRIINIITVNGENYLKFTGKGIVSVDYRGGRL